MITTRNKLTLTFILVVVLAAAILALVTSNYVSRMTLNEVQTRVRLDLNSAHMVYENLVDDIDEILRTVSVACALAPPMDPDTLEAGLGRILQQLRADWSLDILTLVGNDGRVIFRSHNPGVRGDDLSSITVVRKVLESRKLCRGTFLIPRDVLLRDGPGLAERARIEALETPGALPGRTKAEEDGMAIGAAVPFPCPTQGKTLGVLYAANLLNRRYEVVDRIRDIVFQQQYYQGKEIGTSTIFLGDLRISTNVQNADGSRAVGSRLSAEVFENVFTKQQIWAKRAFVVNDWYITAYEPLQDPDGKVIGALYVGLLEKPFARSLRITVLFFLVTLTLTVLAILTTLFYATKITLRPIAYIVAMCRRVIDGDLTARVGITAAGEMGVLCRAIDRMAAAIAQREQLLHQTAQQQIGQSEKLASIGRLAAGIAHEINNPLTGVLTFAHLLKQKENMVEEDRHDLDVIIRETTRVREIVRGLLDFARQSPPTKEPLAINDVIQRTMKLIRSQKEFRNVRIEEALDPELPPVLGDKNQLQQIFLNLALNACEAMPEGGTLTIETFAAGGSVHILFKDTGTGIKKEHMDKIFDPFFTTKPVGKGTGLGLSVSYGTVQQHSGTIKVESEEGTGTTFMIALPLVPQERPPAGEMPGGGA